MMECRRVFEVEEMVLGRVTHMELRRHVAGCDACQEAETMFREELDLFTARRTPPRRLRPVQPRRWAALAVAAGLAIVGSALRTEEHAAPSVLACMMPAKGEALACMLPGSKNVLTRGPIASREAVTSSVLDAKK